MLRACRTASASSSSAPAAAAPRRLAGRGRACGCPASCCSSALGMLVGSDGLGLDPLRRLSTSRRPIGVHRAGADPLRGRPRRRAGARSGRCCGPRSRSRCPGTLITAVVTGLAASWLFGLLDARGAAARLDHRLHGRRGGVLAAARRRGCAGGSSARWRARRASTTRSPCCSCSGSSSGSSSPTTGWPDMSVLFAQQLGIGLVAGVAVGALARAGLHARAALDAGPVPGRVARGGGARVRRRRHARTARASSPSTSAASRSGRRTSRPSGTVTAFHEGLAWVAQLAMFLTLGLLVFPSRAARRRWSTGTLLALVVVFVARPLATALAHGRERLRTCARRRSSAGRACAAPCPSCSPSSRASRASSRRPVTSSTSSSSPCSCRRCCRARRSSRVARRLGVTSGRAERCRRGSSRSARVRELGGDVVEHVIRPGDAAAGARLRELGLPRDALVSLIVRGDEALLPRGSTRLEAGDRLLVLVRREVARELPQLARALAHRAGRDARAAAADLHRHRAGLHRRGPWKRGGRRSGAPDARSAARPSSSTCARAATCPARSSSSPTAATRSWARSSWSARPARSRRRPGGGSARATDDAERGVVAGGHRRLRAVRAGRRRRAGSPRLCAARARPPAARPARARG